MKTCLYMLLCTYFILTAGSSRAAQIDEPMAKELVAILDRGERPTVHASDFERGSNRIEDHAAFISAHMAVGEDFDLRAALAWKYLLWGQITDVQRLININSLKSGGQQSREDLWIF